MPSTKHRCALTCVSANEKPKVLKDKVPKKLAFNKTDFDLLNIFKKFSEIKFSQKLYLAKYCFS